MLLDFYNKYFIEYGDKRVENWILMKDPFLLFAILGGYFYLIYSYLPNYMKGRKAYNLKPFIQSYNVCQVLLCSYMLYEFISAGWFTTYTLGCQPIDYSNDKMAMRMLNITYISFLSKILDLVETIVFVLRLKQKQVSFLHVYHHSVTPLCVWIICKYYGGGMVTFTLMINSFIHVLMYAYYFLAALGPEMQKRLVFFKSKLTSLQLVQFGVMLTHDIQILLPSCNVPNLAWWTFSPHVLANVILFTNFYIKSYTKKESTKLA